MLARGSWVAVSVCLLVAGIGNEVRATSAASLKSCSRCRLLSGWGMGVVPESSFDADTIKTIEGEVVSVQDLPKGTEVVDGVYVLLKTEAGNVAVRLGPASAITGAGVSIEPYDTLTITGSEVKMDDHQGFIATEVCKGSDSIQLRSKSGVVAWR